MSYETYALVRDMIVARALPPVSEAAIGREVAPYALEHWLDAETNHRPAFSEHMLGLDFYLDPSLLRPAAAPHVRELLQKAIAGLEEKRSEKENTRE
jgi:adenylate cyclase